MRWFMLALGFIAVSISALSAPHQHVEAISAQIVAYSGGLSCLNGNGYWSMILRVQPRKDNPATFIRVEFSLPCGKSPEWATTELPIHKFHLIRHRESDTELTGTIAVEDSLENMPKQGFEVAMPIWSFIPGTKPFSLPFGQVLPSYYSVEHPLLPVI